MTRLSDRLSDSIRTYGRTDGLTDNPLDQGEERDDMTRDARNDHETATDAWTPRFDDRLIQAVIDRVDSEGVTIHSQRAADSLRRAAFGRTLVDNIAGTPAGGVIETHAEQVWAERASILHPHLDPDEDWTPLPMFGGSSGRVLELLDAALLALSQARAQLAAEAGR